MPQDCRVHGELRLEQHPFHFYVGEGRPSSPPKSWRHLLDVATDDVLRHDANEIFARLEAAKWLGQLKASPGNVFEFEDGKLSTGGDCSYATKCVNPYVFQARARPHITATSKRMRGSANVNR